RTRHSKRRGSNDADGRCASALQRTGHWLQRTAGFEVTGSVDSSRHMEPMVQQRVRRQEAGPGERRSPRPVVLRLQTATPRSDARVVLPALLLAAVALAALEAVQESMVRGGRLWTVFRQVFPLLLPPWSILALLAIPVREIVERGADRAGRWTAGIHVVS